MTEQSGYYPVSPLLVKKLKLDSYTESVAQQGIPWTLSTEKPVTEKNYADLTTPGILSAHLKTAYGELLLNMKASVSKGRVSVTLSEPILQKALTEWKKVFNPAQDLKDLSPQQHKLILYWESPRGPKHEGRSIESRFSLKSRFNYTLETIWEVLDGQITPIPPDLGKVAAFIKGIEDDSGTKRILEKYKSDIFLRIEKPAENWVIYAGPRYLGLTSGTATQTYSYRIAQDLSKNLYEISYTDSLSNIENFPEIQTLLKDKKIQKQVLKEPKTDIAINIRRMSNTDEFQFSLYGKKGKAEASGDFIDGKVIQ
jgi:hypothetical protein